AAGRPSTPGGRALLLPPGDAGDRGGGPAGSARALQTWNSTRPLRGGRGALGGGRLRQRPVPDPLVPGRPVGPLRRVLPAGRERVLAIAEDPARPLLERVAFLAMSCDAVDDFFQIRVAGLKEQQEAPQALTSPDGLTPARQLRAIRGRVEGLVERHTRLFVEELKPQLRDAGIVICDAAELSDADRQHLTAEFRERIFPVLTPLAVDPGHPFPYISN